MALQLYTPALNFPLVILLTGGMRRYPVLLLYPTHPPADGGRRSGGRIIWVNTGSRVTSTGRRGVGEGRERGGASRASGNK